MRRLAVTVLAGASLSACSTGIDKLPGVNTPGSTARAPAPAPTGAPPPSFRSPEVQRARGLDGVIGAQAGALTQRFGQARIDLVEGDARKLQFLGSACVLDIFLYPLAAGDEPVATHVEARLRKDGSDTDRARCIREVETQR